MEYKAHLESLLTSSEVQGPPLDLNTFVLPKEVVPSVDEVFYDLSKFNNPKLIYETVYMLFLYRNIPVDKLSNILGAVKSTVPLGETTVSELVKLFAKNGKIVELAHDSALEGTYFLHTENSIDTYNKSTFQIAKLVLEAGESGRSKYIPNIIKLFNMWYKRFFTDNNSLCNPLKKIKYSDQVSLLCLAVSQIISSLFLEEELIPNALRDLEGL